MREYADQHSVSLAEGTWEFLRPSTAERAREVVSETDGVAFAKTHPEDMDMDMFDHLGLV